MVKPRDFFMSIRMLFIVFLSFLVVACGGSGSSLDSTREEITIASYQSPCYGESQRLCLVRLEFGDEELFYEEIEDFNHVWGHTYELSVLVTKLDEPAEDGSDVSYSLDEVLSRVEDEIATEYAYEEVELLESTFTVDNDIYYFLGQPFECATDVDCDGLVDMNNSGGLVNVTFEYLGAGEIALIAWD
ncbi:DUF4377 domain-containing protein [Corallincola luteus]|uniref:DUF4377 domain-containing protein n=2 Tax=Corallincola luteus TaxID=1775177 RepID=A0ABY2ANC9_9GAMM|nr:DUF4377 domain-containing protein [Corallincola luteus]